MLKIDNQFECWENKYHCTALATVLQHTLSLLRGKHKFDILKCLLTDKITMLTDPNRSPPSILVQSHGISHFEATIPSLNFHLDDDFLI